MKRRESDILRACQDWLEANNILYIRVNPISPTGDGGWRKPRASQRGAPDLVVFYRDWSEFLNTKYLFPLAVECKSPKGELSPHQQAWKERAKQIRLGYVVVREIEDLVRVVGCGCGGTR